MKPHVICHMGSSVDGRTLMSRWSPAGKNAAGLFERLHEELKGDAWLIGRGTGQEFSKRSSGYPAVQGQKLPREAWRATQSAGIHGVVLDALGKIAWGRSDIGGDPIVTVLTTMVSDAHLAGLRSDGVSYFFAGSEEIDLALALEILNRDFGVKRLLLEGGGTVNGAFLRAGLIDEISLFIMPAVDGSPGAPSVFDSSDGPSAARAPLESMTLQSSQTLEGGAVWLRYGLVNRKT